MRSDAAPPRGPLIHIGYHKTGSSWLQAHLFKPGNAGFWWGGKGVDSPVQRLVTTSPLDFETEAARRDFAGEAAKAARRQCVHVVSMERLSGHPFSGGYDSAEIARRLHETFPGGRVLIVIREQKSIIVSTYRQYVRGGGALPMRLFVDPPAYRHPRVTDIDLRHFEYHRLLAFYRELFGERNVLTLPQEQLRGEPRRFVDAIVGFAGAAPQPDALERLRFDQQANVTLRGALVPATRLVNRLFVRNDINPLPLLASERGARAGRRVAAALGVLRGAGHDQKVDRRLHEMVAEVVGDRFAQSNREWVRMTGIDLGDYGYDVGPASVRAEDKAFELR